MKKSRKLLIIAIVTATISLIRAADDKAVKKDIAQLQGEWVMVSGSADGQSMPEDDTGRIKGTWIFGQNRSNCRMA